MHRPEPRFGPPFYVEAHRPDTLRSLFTGRAQELLQLDELLRRADGSPVVVIGMRGSGRTALCRTYADLRGTHYGGVLFCSGQRFMSAEALIDYIAFERAQLANRRETGTSGHAEPRPLLVIDDADIFTPRALESVLRLAQARPPGVVPLLSSQMRLQSLGPFATRQFELRLHGLPESDVEALLAKHVASGTVDRQRVEDFIAAAYREGLRMAQLTPRIVLELFYRHQSTTTSLKESIAEFAASGVAPSNLVVFEHEGRLRAAPALQGEVTGIVESTAAPLLAAPYVVIPHLAALWRVQLEEFEGLLADPTSNERSFQAFFEVNPHFLQGIEYGRIVAHPALIREDDGPLIPDFMLQPIQSKYANILDLKHPAAQIVAGRKDRRRFAQGVHEAIAQVRVYRDYFERSDYRRAVEQRYGMTAYRPSTIIVIGRQPETVPEDEMKRIESDAPNFVTIQTYDDVLRTMRRMVELKER